MMRGKMAGLMGMAFAMAAVSGAPMYGMPRTRIPERRRDKYPSINSSYRHVGPIPKGCRMETVRITFKKDEELINGHFIHVDVDLVYATNKAREKKLRKYQKEIGDYITNRWIGDLQKNKMFIIEPIVK